MQRKLTITLEQARTLQAELHPKPEHEKTSWGKWTYVVEVPVPEVPDNIQDMERIQAALKMADMGCSDMQIAESLHWKYPGVAIRAVMRLVKDAAKAAAAKAQ